MKCINCGTELNAGMAFCPNCGAAQNNLQYGNAMPVKTKSKTPLIIALAVAIVIIIGLAVTCVVLIVSDNSSSKNDSVGAKLSINGKASLQSSTAEDTVSAFLDALLEQDYSQAFYYVFSGDIDYFDFGDTDLSKAGLKRNYRYLTGYEIAEFEKLDSDDVEEANEYINYSDEITDVYMFGIYFIYNDDDYDDAAVYVAKTNDGWYIIGIDN